MRVPELVSSPSPAQLHTQQAPPAVLPARAPLLATPPSAAAATAMANTSITSNTSGVSSGSGSSGGAQLPQLSEQLIFAPGAIVEVQTVRQEVITGEVLAFEYDHKLLILKSESSNKQQNSSNVTCVNLNLCSKVNILAEPPHLDQIESELEKLPEIDIKKLEERFRTAVQERQYMIDAYRSGAGIEGISLFSKLQKTFGENPGISWDHDSIIIGKHVRIGSPYRADCVSIRSTGGSGTPPDKVAKTSLDFTKQVVEKYWRDQHKDPYSLSPLANSVGGGAAPVTAASVVASPPPPSAPPAAVSQQQQQPPQPPTVVASTPVVATAPQLSQQNPKGHHHPQQQQHQQHNRSNMNKSSSGGGHNKQNQNQQSNQHSHHHHSHGQQQHHAQHHNSNSHDGPSSRNASVSSTGGGSNAPSSGPSSISSYASLASASLDHGDQHNTPPPGPPTTTNTTTSTKKSIAAVVASGSASSGPSGGPTVARS